MSISGIVFLVSSIAMRKEPQLNVVVGKWRRMAVSGATATIHSSHSSQASSKNDHN